MIVSHKSHKDKRGILLPVSLKEIPFEVKRVFFISDVPQSCIRGGHGHKECLQYVLCLTGSILMTAEKSFKLSQGEGFLIPKNTWTEERFLEPNTVIAVFCSEEYDPKDYIHEKP